MSDKPTKQWNTSQIKQYEMNTGQALLSDEQTLASFSQDFGKLIQSSPSAVCMPKNITTLQLLISFAKQEKLPVTIRGNGLSQSGQSLPIPGGLTLSMQHFTKVFELSGDSIWVEGNATWSNLLELSLQQNKAPYVLPYNCNLSVAGVLSVGGVGASSFKHGAINAHVQALEVVDGLGTQHTVDTNSPLFHACLSGQGRYAVITKAQIKLRPAKQQVKTFYLVYSDQQQWFDDIEKAKQKADYMELFCSPAIQGVKLVEDRRVPMAQWLYGLHLSIEYNNDAPELTDILGQLKPWNVVHTQEETMSSYMFRHNSRFEVMKMLGQWDLLHPWYECFVPTAVLRENLHQILNDLPIHYASLVHVVPIAKQKADFLMMPDAQSVCSLMILHPGVPHPLEESCLKTIKDLDERLMSQGGKRYLSGFLGKNLPKNYWAKHFGEHYSSWVSLKKKYDPEGIFCSMLHQS